MKFALACCLLLAGCAERKPAKAPFWHDCRAVALDSKTLTQTFICEDMQGGEWNVQVRKEK